MMPATTGDVLIVLSLPVMLVRTYEQQGIHGGSAAPDTNSKTRTHGPEIDFFRSGSKSGRWWGLSVNHTVSLVGCLLGVVITYTPIPNTITHFRGGSAQCVVKPLTLEIRTGPGYM